MKTITKNRLKNNPQLRGYFQSKHVRRAYLFGSYARGEENENSDVDIMIEYDETPSLFEFSRMRIELSELLSLNVDLIPYEGIYGDVKRNIRRDKLLIFKKM